MTGHRNEERFAYWIIGILSLFVAGLVASIVVWAWSNPVLGTVYLVGMIGVVVLPYVVGWALHRVFWERGSP